LVSPPPVELQCCKCSLLNVAKTDVLSYGEAASRGTATARSWYETSERSNLVIIQTCMDLFWFFMLCLRYLVSLLCSTQSEETFLQTTLVQFYQLILEKFFSWPLKKLSEQLLLWLIWPTASTIKSPSSLYRFCRLGFVVTMDFGAEMLRKPTLSLRLSSSAFQVA
jgi:hypothetical protein